MPRGQQPQRGDDRRAIQREQQVQRPASEEMPPDTLRQIIDQTTQSLARPEEADPALKAAMLEVARRFGPAPITVDPVGTALLEAVLRVQLPLFGTREALLAHTARRVAASLLADPAARLRVEHLWATLLEEVA